jgi:2-oxoglutarate ferredoxin oxidoreductase subunit gamma
MTESERQIRLSGSGGQGLQLGAKVLADALTLEGLYVAQSQAYEPTSRGGLSRSDLVACDGAVDYPLVTRLDYLMILDQVAAEVSRDLLDGDTVLLLDSEQVTSPPITEAATYSLGFTEAARRVGNVRAANMVALGALVEVSRICGHATLENALGRCLPARLLELNLEAVREGQRMAAEATAAPAQAVAES